MTLDPTRSLEKLLPLKPLVFRILLSLARGPKHGYALMKELAGEGVPGRRLFPASLYRTLRGMREDGLIAEVPSDIGATDDDRRRYFGITSLGRRAALAEARRMEGLLGLVREVELVPGSDGIA